jgi:hypothetical protein
MASWLEHLAEDCSSNLDGAATERGPQDQLCEKWRPRPSCKVAGVALSGPDCGPQPATHCGASHAAIEVAKACPGTMPTTVTLPAPCGRVVSAGYLPK